MATLAFVGARADDALVVIDVTIPTSPTLVGALKHAYLDGVYSVHMKDIRYAYTACNTEDSLTVVDLADLAIEGRIAGSGSPNYLNGAAGVFVLGIHAYVASLTDNSLSIFDISTPSAPTLEGVIRGTANYLYRAMSVFVVGDYAYVACGGDAVDAGLTIIDVSTPSAPTYKGGLYGAGAPNYLKDARGVYVVGDYAYVASNAIAAADNALVIINVSDPAVPTLEGVVRGAGAPNWLQGATGIFVLGNYAYVASNQDHALSIFDISDKTAPTVAGSIHGSGDPNYLAGTMGVFVIGNYAYVTAWTDNALVIVNVTNKAAPFLAGVIRGADAPNWLEMARGIYVQSGYFASTITSQAITDIEPTRATGNGTVTSLGTPEAVQHGVCWSESLNPTTADNKTEEGVPSVGAFASNITDLTPSTLYHVRAYVINTMGTHYGADETFTTLAPYHYIIYNVDDLQAMENDLTGYYELANDIDASETAAWNAGAGFMPIGQATYFTGSFDGKGFTIDQLTINRPTASQVGLFRWARDFITIKDVKLTSCDITGGDDWYCVTGALVGRLYGYSSEGIIEIEGCSSSGNVSGNGSVGGLFGEVTSKGDLYIHDCYSSCTVTTIGGYAGGFAAWVSDCHISRCYATGNVTVNADDIFAHGGGFIGALFAGITSECYATGNVVVNNISATRRAEAGGFIGSAGSTVGETLTFVVGNCYARGNATANSIGSNLEYAGGFIGRFIEDDGTIEKCYSTGVPSGFISGGFCADWGGVNTSINDCFWDTDTSGEAASDGGTGKTTAEMKTKATFTDAGWDFTTVWNMLDFCNDGYACLRGVTPFCLNPVSGGNPGVVELLT